MWTFLFETDQFLGKLDNEETGNAFCFSEGWGPERNEGHVMADALNVHDATGLAPSQLQARVAELEAALRPALEFVELFSNRWDGQHGRHPFGIVTDARKALGVEE